ncbi:DNA-directed RNA polymerase sigma-70 factor [Parapedobacter defluvii]|uniref:DNA-directed RNA polymerase sigma-70 factor n=1 Tax=Parapedobacter defluvii TaxID=2045106 RepID=A0ABQ1LYS4_9SPHI|nr:RNA polymerase sigma-70 factor [Parapedobacter defluvii]GGC32115.1 DNA-directed RNA polymerase sigma-70 factor [Parapedobacter defluvii]
MTSIHRHDTDKELVTKLRQDDEAALSEIYERYWDRLFVVAANRLGDPQEAEECVQDVLYKLWRLRETLHIENDDLSGYLAVSIRNQVFNRRLKRHRERLRVAEYETTDAGHPSPELVLIAKELQKRIDRAINNLPTQCRIVFELSRQEGKTVKQVADQLAISENTVKYHLKKANRDIRESLDLSVWLAVIYYFFQK